MLTEDTAVSMVHTVEAASRSTAADLIGTALSSHQDQPLHSSPEWHGRKQGLPNRLRNASGGRL
jgi:hypothetical protein